MRCNIGGELTSAKIWQTLGLKMFGKAIFLHQGKPNALTEMNCGIFLFDPEVVPLATYSVLDHPGYSYLVAWLQQTVATSMLFTNPI